MRDAAPSPAAVVALYEKRARRLATPCAAGGDIVWHVWGRGEPLILLHGGSGSWTHWLRNIDALGAHYEIWVPDLPGLGQSAMPREPHVPASVAAELVDGIEMLLPHDQPLRLAGFSFGGHIAGLVARQLGPWLQDLTLIGVAGLGLRADPREPFAKERSGMSPDELAQVHAKNLAILMIADPAKIDPLAIHLQQWNAQHARFRSRPFAPTEELARALAEIYVPVKTIWGTQDVIARPSVELRLDILRTHHPELEVRLIGDAGHWVMYEAADAFNAAFLELLAL